MRVRRTVGAAVVLAASLCSITAQAEVVELKALEKRALERHFSLRAGEARTRAAEAGVREAKSGYMPHVGVNVDSNLGPGRKLITITEAAPTPTDPNARRDVALVQGFNALHAPGQTSPLTPQWRSTASLVLGMNIYDFGRTGAAVEASRARANSAGAEQ